MEAEHNSLVLRLEEKINHLEQENSKLNQIFAPAPMIMTPIGTKISLPSSW